MRDGLDPGTSEFNNFGFDINIAKFVNYHAKTQDLSTNARSNSRSSARSVSGTYRAPGNLSHRSDRSNSYYTDKCYQDNSKPLTSRKNYSMTCIDKCLTTIPSEVLQKQCILTVLDLSRNQFEEFPQEIFLIQQLRILRIDYNRIKYIPSDITKLTELEALSVSHNLLQKLPTHLGKLPNFRELNVEANIIDNFAPDAAHLKRLRTLNLLQNKFTLFPCAFRELLKLEEFQFEWFKYANPPLDSCQKGEDGESNIMKLRTELTTLYHKGEDSMTFEEFIKFFSEQKVNLKYVNNQGQSILHLACLNEDMAVVRYLLREYPDLLESIDEERLTPLCASILKDKTKSIFYLMKNGANVVTGRSYHGSPIHIAAKRLNYSALKEIIRLGENPNKVDGKGNTPLHYAVTLFSEGVNKATHIIQHLLEQGADPNAKSKENMAPIHLATKRKDCKALNWMLNYNFELQEIHGGEDIFNINMRGGGYKWTPMHIAVYYDSPEIVMALGEAEADIFKRSGNGHTPKTVLKRSGLTHKLIDKYEKQWIKKNVLFKRNYKQECLTSFNLKNLNVTKEIKNASKNKFCEKSFRFPSIDKGIKTKLEFYIPMVGKGVVFQDPNYENSFDVSPETEGDIKTSIDEVDNLKDYCSEFSEHVRVETDACAMDLVYYGRGNGQSQNNRLSYYPNLREKASSRNNYEVLELDIEAMSAPIKTKSTLNFAECVTQVNTAQDALLSDSITFSDKIKTLFGLKSLYHQVEKHITQKYLRSMNVDSFPLYMLQEINRRNKIKDSFKPKDLELPEMLGYYEVVPKCLIGVFSKLDALNFENQLLKTMIINIISDLKYFPGLDFLQSIKTSTDPIMVTREAQKTFGYLQSLLQGNSTVTKENQVSKTAPVKERKSIFQFKS